MNDLKVMVKKNFENSKMLNKENDEVYTDIVCYLRVSLLEDVKTEEIISDILDMFLRSQEEGKAIEEIIGDDYKAFCDSIIESVEPKKFSLARLKESVFIIVDCFFILLTIDLVLNYLPKVIKYKILSNYAFSVSFFINSVIIIILAVGIVNYIGRNSFSLTKNKPSKVTYFLIWLGFVVTFSAIIFTTFKLSKYELFSVNICVVIIPVAIYWIYKKIPLIARAFRM